MSPKNWQRSLRTLYLSSSSIHKKATNIMVQIALSALVLVSAVVAGASAHCYTNAVAAAQTFDDSFVCNEVNQPYPDQYIEEDLRILWNNGQPEKYGAAELFDFIDITTQCFNETGFSTNTYQSPGDYGYSCVCPTQRRRIEKVYVNQYVCHVVYPQQQDIEYAQCRGHCIFDYKTQIAGPDRGYFCVHQSFVQREFLVWCPLVDTTTNVPLKGAGYGEVPVTPNNPGGYEPFGHFEKVTYNLPTLCSCRGYFCNDHSNVQIPQVTRVH